MPKAPKKATAKKKTTTKAEPKVELSGVRIDPNLPLLPGNHVTFVARAPEGRGAVKVETARGAWMGVPSISSGEAHQAKILEAGEITVSFYEDGTKYAEGSWTV